MKKWDFKAELRRKASHLFSLFFILLYVILKEPWGERIALLSLTLLLIIFLELEFIRIKIRSKIPIIRVLWREKENDKLGAQVFFLIGAIIALSVFDFKIAVMAILMTTFGDMASALIGMKFGKHWLKRIPNKAWEGIIAEFSVDMIVGFILFPNLLIVLLMALTATFVETYFTHADDNMLIPIFSGFVGQITFMLLL